MFFPDSKTSCDVREFLRDLLRQRKHRLEAAALRSAVIEGYRDLQEGCYVAFEGSLEESMAEAKRRARERR